MIIKVKYKHDGKHIARKIDIRKNISLEELEQKLRERFDINYDKRVELHFLDEENDRIVISFEDELALILASQKAPIFELIVKAKVVDNFFTYPKITKSKPGEIAEVFIESKWLTTASILRRDTRIWGTLLYTDDSDIVKALVHLGKLELTEQPPSYNLIVSLRYLPGCLKYIGSSNEGITSEDFGPHDASYVIESFRIVALT
ncbi:Rxt3-domain-containing protein [Gigaspora margarita]|uniref:Rxt3-domain-containing protein n=1 Tax=Gigaspora margarita TaxID=4874 RepID=A0A8H4AZ96_GIGMA|nr:Rxt3-domain-containing protein [Gigaspora margarita]